MRLLGWQNVGFLVALGSEVCPQESYTLYRAFRCDYQQAWSVRKAWGAFLAAFSWRWFGTLTFRMRVSRETAWRTLHAFMSEIQGPADSSLGWFVVEGTGTLFGRIHFHFLVTGTPASDRRDCERMWFRLAGNALIREYNPQSGAAFYCAKHLGTNAPEYYISENLSALNAQSFGCQLNSLERISCDVVMAARAEESLHHVVKLAHTAKTTQSSSTETKEHGSETEEHIENHNTKHDHRDESDYEKARERTNTSANPSTRWRDLCGGTSVRRTTVPATHEREVEDRDKQLRAQWSKARTATDAARRELMHFGRLCDEARSLELHKYVRKPGSRKGYVSFEEYIHDLTGGQLSKSNLYNSINLHKLTQGPNALPEEDVAAMPVQNACLLGRLKPEQRTPDLVEAAKKASKREFPAKIQDKLNEDLPAAQQRTPRVDFFRKLHPTVANKLEETIEMFTHLRVVRDGDRELTLQEKAIYAICNAAEQFASEDLAVEERLRREEIDVPDL